jgi:hypothetical protein
MPNPTIWLLYAAGWAFLILPDAWAGDWARASQGVGIAMLVGLCIAWVMALLRRRPDA